MVRISLDEAGEVHGLPLLYEDVLPAQDESAGLSDLETDDVTHHRRAADLTLVQPTVRPLQQQHY